MINVLKKRRPKPNTVFVYSIIFGIIMSLSCFWEIKNEGWQWAALWGLLAGWFFVDAVRAYGWLQNIKAQEQEKQKSPEFQEVTKQDKKDIFKKKN